MLAGLPLQQIGRNEALSVAVTYDSLTAFGPVLRLRSNEFGYYLTALDIPR